MTLQARIKKSMMKERNKRSVQQILVQAQQSVRNHHLQTNSVHQQQGALILAVITLLPQLVIPIAAPFIPENAQNVENI